MMIKKMLPYAASAVLVLLPTASQAHPSVTSHHHPLGDTYYLEAAGQADELQQLLDQLSPDALEQLYQALTDKTEQFSSEADNYLQCLQDQQAIAPSEPLDLSTFISEALTTGKACQFLLDDLVEKLRQSPPNKESQDNMDELLRKSL